jgi:two-component system CheB/CheR fusion protein
MSEARRVLVVEDDEDVAEVVSMMARSLGHRVEWVPTGGLALSMTPSFDPEVILLDLRLPDMDGFEVARRLRAIGDRRHPMISALTGLVDGKAWEEAAASGFDHYLVKPTSIRDLERVIGSKPATEQRRRRTD